MEKNKKQNSKHQKVKSNTFKKTNSNFNTLKKDDSKKFTIKRENEEEKKIKEQNQKDKELHNINQDTIKNLQKELELLEKEFNEIENKNTQTKNQISYYGNDINIKKKIISTKKTRLISLKETNSKLEKQLKELEEELKQNEEEEEENRHINIGQLFQNAFMRLNGNPLNFFPIQEGNNNINDTGLTMEQLLNLPNSKYYKMENNNEKCEICGFLFCYNDTISKLERCRHVFHRECLFNYLQNRSSSKCPTCKVSII